MRIKDGVRFSSPEMAMCIATIAVRDVFTDFGQDMLEFCITGGIEDHQHPSKHVYGGGLDYRTKSLSLSEDEKWMLTAAVRRYLGDGFDVVLESVGKPNEHLHVEYDPKS